MSVNNSYNVRTNVMNEGLTNIDKFGTDIASEIDTVDVMNQVDMLKMQQKMSAYSNTISMMSNILKGLSDTDKEVIRNT